MSNKQLQANPLEIEQMDQRENEIINNAMEKYGCLDPRDDEGRHAQLLLTAYGDKPYRRFIVDCVELGADELTEDQVRQHVVDTDRATELGSLIDYQGLQYLPFVTRGTSNSSFCNIENGHHRIHYILHDKKDETIPVFVVSNESYEVFEDGTYGKGERDSFKNKVAAIRSNPPSVNKPYNLSDVAIQFAELFKTDPYLGGINPTGKFPERIDGKLNPVFEKLMDWLHPEQFRGAIPRGTIFNKWDRARDGAKIKNVSFDDITALLVTEGYDPGVTTTPRSGKKTRLGAKDFLNHYDEKNKTYIAITNDNGKNFEATIAWNLLKAHAKQVLHGGEDHQIVVVARIYKPDSTLTRLNKQRAKFAEVVKEANAMAKFFNVPFGYTKVIFPKQLTNASDEGKTIDLSETIDNVVAFDGKQARLIS